MRLNSTKSLSPQVQIAIKELLVKDQLSQTWLANLVNTTQSVICRALQGKQIASKVAEDLSVLVVSDKLLTCTTGTAAVGKNSTKGLTHDVKTSLKDYLHSKRLDHGKLAIILRTTPKVVSDLRNGHRVDASIVERLEKLLIDAKYLSEEGLCISDSGPTYVTKHSSEKGFAVPIAKVFPRNKQEAVPASFYQNISVPIEVLEPCTKLSTDDSGGIYSMSSDNIFEDPITKAGVKTMEIKEDLTQDSNKIAFDEMLEKNLKSVMDEFLARALSVAKMYTDELSKHLAYMMKEVDRLAPYEQKAKDLEAKLQAIKLAMGA